MTRKHVIRLWSYERYKWRIFYGYQRYPSIHSKGLLVKKHGWTQKIILWIGPDKSCFGSSITNLKWVRLSGHLCMCNITLELIPEGQRSSCLVSLYEYPSFFLGNAVFAHWSVALLQQDYIDSMEGATLSGRQTSARINEVGSELHDLRQRIAKVEANASLQGESAKDELSFV